MTIIRDGNKFDLTKDELYRAWVEQDDIFDCENITDELTYKLDGMTEDSIIEEYGMTRRALEELIPEMAHEYRLVYENSDHICEAIWSCRDDAINNVVARYRTESENESK